MKNILIIEPDSNFANILKKSLSVADYKIFTANSAQNAIFVADKTSPDLVILELAMSDQNGVAFLYEFRSYSDWLKVPIIIHTHIPNSDPVIYKKLQELDVVEYLYKPSTSLSLLRQKILEILDS